jgi:hypothetical protein
LRQTIAAAGTADAAFIPASAHLFPNGQLLSAAGRLLYVGRSAQNPYSSPVFAMPGDKVLLVIAKAQDDY